MSLFDNFLHVRFIDISFFAEPIDLDDFKSAPLQKHTHPLRRCYTVSIKAKLSADFPRFLFLLAGPRAFHILNNFLAAESWLTSHPWHKAHAFAKTQGKPGPLKM